MKKLENIKRISLLSRHGTLKPIKFVLSTVSLSLLEKAIFDSHYSVSAIAERELNDYKRGSKHNFLGTDFIFSKSQCVRILRHEIRRDYFEDYYIGFFYV